MKTYIHGTNALVLDLWKQTGVPSGTYFGLLESREGKKGIPKGVNPIVDATFRNTDWGREDVFDKVMEAYERLGVPLPDDAAKKFETPVVVFVRKGEFEQDPREDYMFLSQEQLDGGVEVMRLDPEASFRDRAKDVVDHKDLERSELKAAS